MRKLILRKEIMENKQQIIDKINKLFAIAKGSSNSKFDSAEIANEALSAMMMARKLLAKYKIDESEIQQKAEAEHTIYIAPQYGRAIVINPYKRANAKGLNKRRIWFEKLANVVAEGNYCKIGIIPTEGGVEFFGLEMDREVAIFTFEKLAEIADILCRLEAKKAKTGAGAFNFRTKEKVPEWIDDDVFSESFHQGFREKIAELLSDEDGNLKSSEGVQEYWEKACRYDQRPDYIWDNWQYKEDEIEINEYYVNVGRKVGDEAIKRLNLQNGTQEIQGLIKTNLIKKQEKAEKDRKLLYDKLGINESLPMEVFIAIDSSGSMGYTQKMEQAKSGALSFAKDAAQKGCKVGLVSFGAMEDFKLDPSDKVNGEFTQAIDKLVAYGSTPMHKGIENATDYFRTIKARRTLVIVTDGHPDSKEMALNAAQKAKDIGTIIQCIGTDDAPKDFMDKLASSGNAEQVGNNMLGEGIRRMAGLLGS